MSSKKKTQEEFSRRYAHIAVNAARRASKMFDSSGMRDVPALLERPTGVPGTRGEWDRPEHEKAKLIEKAKRP